MSRDLVIRADATASHGAGHVMRCLSLAEAWRELGIGAVKLYGDVTIDFVERRMRELEVENLESLQLDVATILLVDSYDPEIRARMSRSGQPSLRVLVDDLGVEDATGYDIIWNPNAYGSRALYPSFPGRVIAGSDAVPLMDHPVEWKPMSSDVCLVTLGSGTIDARLRQAFEELSRSSPGIRFHGTGEWVPAGWSKVRPELLWTDAAACRFLITAAGSSVWQAASIGPPMVVVKTAENQRLVADWVSGHEVPVVDAMASDDSYSLSRELLRACQRAKPLPRLSNGSRTVALGIEQTAPPNV